MDKYIIMYRPPTTDKYYPVGVADTLDIAEKYVRDNVAIEDKYYIDLIPYIKE